MFFYLYFIGIVLDFLLISNIIPFTSAAYTVHYVRLLDVSMDKCSM